MPPVAPEARGFGQHSVQLDSQSPACMLTCCFPLLLGCEVAVGQRVALSNQKVAFFTWHGATVEVQGKPDIVYVDGGTQLGVLLPCTGSESNRNLPPVGMWLATRPWRPTSTSTPSWRSDERPPESPAQRCATLLRVKLDSSSELLCPPPLD